MSCVIALFNQAGGVGKTTLAMNLGYSLVQRRRQVLLVDMDPQSSLTTFMGLEPETLEQTVYEAVVGEENLPIYPELLHGLALAPANINLSAAEIELVSALARELRLKSALAPVLDNYDFILIDCPPSLGLLSIVSLVAANYILVPIQCQFKSFQGTDLLLRTIASLRKALNPQLKIAGFVPTMYDQRTVQESSTKEAIASQLAPLGQIFDPIPKSIAFADASQARLPLALFNRKHPAIAILDKMAKKLDKLE